MEDLKDLLSPVEEATIRVSAEKISCSVDFQNRVFTTFSIKERPYSDHVK
jgi:hypothetical protein